MLETADATRNGRTPNIQVQLYELSQVGFCSGGGYLLEQHFWQTWKSSVSKGRRNQLYIPSTKKRCAAAYCCRPVKSAIMRSTFGPVDMTMYTASRLGCGGRFWFRISISVKAGQGNVRVARTNDNAYGSHFPLGYRRCVGQTRAVSASARPRRGSSTFQEGLQTLCCQEILRASYVILTHRDTKAYVFERSESRRSAS